MGNVLFGYGEFLRDEVLQELLGHAPPKMPAVLRGYKRVLEKSTGFYNIVPSKRGVVEGVVMTDISDEDLSKLDLFEEASALYYREPHEVETPKGRITAWVYIRKS